MNIKVLAGCIMMTLCVNFSQQESDTPKEKPTVNFYGSLVDSTGDEFSVSNITINGLYKGIPVYAKPPEPGIEPEKNTTFIDLAETTEIRPAYQANPREGLQRYHERTYIEIVIVSNDRKKTKNNYLVEESRKIICDVDNEAGPLEKQLSFEALKRLKIEGHERREEEKESTKAKHKRDLERERQCREAGKTLRKLEKEAQNVSEPEKSKITELIETVKNWVGGICGS